MDTIANSLIDLLFNIINIFLSVILAPVNTALQPVLAGVLTSEQLLNFYNVVNLYVLPTCGFFINLIPPLTWNAIVIFILFYIGLFSVVTILHGVLKILRVVKRLVPFV